MQLPAKSAPKTIVVDASRRDSTFDDLYGAMQTSPELAQDISLDSLG
jgi:hypothetical protein